MILIWNKKLLEQLAKIAVEKIFLFTPNNYNRRNIIEFGRFSGIPVIFVNRGLNGRYCGSIMIDEYLVSYCAIEWLISERHQKIGLIMDNSEHDHLAERFDTYQQIIVDYDLIIEEEYIKQMLYLLLSGTKELLND